MGNTISIEQKNILTLLGFFHLHYRYINISPKSLQPHSAINPPRDFYPSFLLLINLFKILSIRVFLKWQQMFASLPLRLLLFLFISVILFIDCLLINARWYVHFELYINSTSTSQSPCLKFIRVWYTTVCLFVNNREILFPDQSSCIVIYFVLSPLAFLINFVTDAVFEN